MARRRPPRRDGLHAAPPRICARTRRNFCKARWRSISARLDYRPRADGAQWVEREFARLDDGDAAVVSIYARGRDYHKVLRDRLQKLATRIEQTAGNFRYRVCTDSAPVFEIELARRGPAWAGAANTHCCSHATRARMFFVGEILTDLPLPLDAPVDDHCGTCQRCIDICPTRAITAP